LESANHGRIAVLIQRELPMRKLGDESISWYLSATLRDAGQLKTGIVSTTGVSPWESIISIHDPNQDNKGEQKWKGLSSLLLFSLYSAALF